MYSTEMTSPLYSCPYLWLEGLGRPGYPPEGAAGASVYTGARRYEAVGAKGAYGAGVEGAYGAGAEGAYGAGPEGAYGAGAASCGSPYCDGGS
jgi:hypothetical protein